MVNQPKTAQGWAWDYLKTRLETVTKLFESSENLPRVMTFSDLKEGELFIRLPWFWIEDNKLVFKNVELYRKIKPVKYADGSGGPHTAITVMTGSLHEFPENEPVIIIK